MVDVPKDGTPPPVEISLRKGVTLEAKVVAPDGQIVKDVTAMYPGIDAKLIDIWNQGQEFSDGNFRIKAPIRSGLIGSFSSSPTRDWVPLPSSSTTLRNLDRSS